MPFRDPTFGGIDLDEGKYFVKVKALEDAPEGQFGPGIKWIFTVATPEGGVVKDDRGFDAEFWQFSSDSLSSRSKGGKWAAALLGRELTPQDKGSEIAKALIGKKGVALIADNEEGTRKNIVKMSPMVVTDENGNGETKSIPPQPPEEPPDEVILKSPGPEEVPAIPGF